MTPDHEAAKKWAGSLGPENTFGACGPDMLNLARAYLDLVARDAEIAALKQRVAELERELAGARGVSQADDARLRAAERRVYDDPDLTFGCDAADHMADMVLELRQHNAELERELEAARNVCEAAGVVIDDTRNASYADCCVNKGKVCDLLAALAAYRATTKGPRDDE